MSVGALLIRRWPALTAVWVTYIAILLPVLGIVQNGWQIAADRYTYLACIGWVVLAGGIVGAWCEAENRRLRRAVVLIGAAGVAVTLGTLTWRQARIWHDSATLWTHAVTVSPSVTGHYNLAVFLFRQGEVDSAITHYRQALALKPDFAEGHNNLGVALARKGQIDEAILHYERALAAKPDYADAHYNLGLALMRQGRQREAAEHFRRVLAIRPDFPDVRNNLDRAVSEGRLAR